MKFGGNLLWLGGVVNLWHFATIRLIGLPLASTFARRTVAGAIITRRMLVVSKGRWGLATKLASDRSLDNDRDKTLAGHNHVDNSS